MTAVPLDGDPPRIVLAIAPRLVRGVLAYALAASGQVLVTAEAGTREDIARRIREPGCDVLVADLNLATVEGVCEVASRSCPVLVLAEPKPDRRLAQMLAVRPATVSLLGTNAHPVQVVAALHRISAGETVLDADLMAVAHAAPSPLTGRELEVLQVAAAGWPVRDIARQLQLSPGTVRNHLSKILAKTAAHSRMEAVRRARSAGWL